MRWCFNLIRFDQVKLLVPRVGRKEVWLKLDEHQLSKCRLPLICILTYALHLVFYLPIEQARFVLVVKLHVVDVLLT